jgi:prepilin signal peptidase PulO-like enzyme (type II secretory pathway)
MVGAFLGLKLTVLVVFLAPIMATLFALVMLLVDRGAGRGLRANDGESRVTFAGAFLAREVPFGVFLGTSSLIALFLGKQIWGWYFGLFR